ncbi:MAG: cytochrome family [Solirubrobacterales bacterium]|nr:cytochrome family [Solirubrobacterales bacterium]
MALPPGPRTPALVNTVRFGRHPLEMLLGWQRRYGNVFTTKFLVFGTGVYVAEPEEIRKLFTGDQSDLHAGEANAPLSAVLGEHSVLVLDGPEHLRQRKLLLPPFQGARLSAMRPMIREVAAVEVDRWAIGSEFEMREPMRHLTFEVISRAVFGVYEPERIERLREAMLAVIDTQILFFMPEILRRDYGRFTPGGWIGRRLEKADALLYEEIERRRHEPDLDERTDVLSLLLRARDEDGQPMTDVELRDELFTMLGAGHETTSTGLAWAVDLLLHNPDVLERTKEAIETGDDAYLEAVATETLRIRPVIDAAERTLKAPRTIAGWDLPEGIRVYPGIALIHHREDLYPEPERFRPERFTEEKAESYTWLPFGGGIRRCIGAGLAQMEMVEVLRVIFGRVELEPVRPEPEEVVLKGITIAPRRGAPVRVVAKRPREPGGEAELNGQHAGDQHGADDVVAVDRASEPALDR